MLKIIHRISIRQLITIFVVSPFLLALTVYCVTSIIIESWLWAVVGVILVQIFQIVCQLVVGKLVRFFGIFAFLTNCFIGYAVAVWLGLSFLPGLESITFTESILIAWLYALLITILQWALLVASDDFLLNQFIRESKNGKPQSHPNPGFVFVQLDGVSSHLVEDQLEVGGLPNIKHLIETGGYKFEKWRTQIPSTTPASQAGILFGSNSDIPAFRWYERVLGGLVVANQIKGAQLIEKRLSSGKGLLADGGVSVGNLFSGDAEENIMVMSKLEGNQASKANMGEYSKYLSGPHGFMRLFILSIGEMVKEIFQAHRQKAENVTPRVERHGSFIFLRAATNVYLRDLQTKIVLDKMSLGVNSLYVDFLDYDEIAHHAGVARPESLGALKGLDKVIGLFAKASNYTQRTYHIVFVSDHGQSQGQTFSQLNNGVNLESLLAKLLNTSDIEAAVDDSETRTSAKSLASHQKQFARLAHQPDAKPAKKNPKVVVTGSGNLGNIWLTVFKSRPTKEQIDKAFPSLIKDLLATQGVGLVMVNSKEYGLVAIGAEGFIQLKDGTIKGENPLTKYPNATKEELFKLRSMKNAPDIQLISSYDKATNEVFAFEELVGNHGGIGGWQTDALMLHPGELKIKKRFYTKGQLVDSTAIHAVFVDWLETAGHRKSIRK